MAPRRDPATLAADYATLAAPLGLDPAEPDQAKLTAAIRDALPDLAPVLLVFDNVEDPPCRAPTCPAPAPTSSSPPAAPTGAASPARSPSS